MHAHVHSWARLHAHRGLLWCYSHTRGVERETACTPFTCVRARVHLQVVPKALADKWAWMRWDYEGRPQQSGPEATKHYDTGVEVRKGFVLEHTQGYGGLVHACQGQLFGSRTRHQNPASRSSAAQPP